jgi:hypothetical protein
MTEEHGNDELDKMLFANLVMMLSSSAMQQLGKLVNPETKKSEVNLEAAQLTIDMLSMLKNKTRGNLSKEEDGMLNGILSSLQMNYVETAASAPSKPVEPPNEEPPANETAKASEPTEPKKSAEKRDPKYHKTYGS